MSERDDRRNVVVVGAGLAGLAAAVRLQADGHEVSLVERGDRAGGGHGCAWAEGFCLERRFEPLCGTDRRLTGLIAEAGLRDRMLPLRPLQLTQLHEGRADPIDPQSLTAAARIPGVRSRDAVRLVRWSRLMSRYRPLLDPTAPERAASLDFRSASDFVRLYFGESCHAFWTAPEATSVFSGDAEELSRVCTLLLWAARRTAADRSAHHGLARAPLAELPEALAERVPIHFGVEVSRIDEEPAGGFAVECQKVGGGRGELHADVVVLAVAPAEALRIAHAMVSPAERDYLGGVRHRPGITLSLALDRAPAGMPELIRVPRSEGLPADCILFEPGMAEGKAPMGAGLALVRASERFVRTNAAAHDDVVQKGLIAGLERIHPGIAGAVRASLLTREEAAMPAFDVGAYRALATFRAVQADRRALSRRLYFAGRYLIGPRAEDAVVSGLRAAQEIREDLSEL